MSFLINPYMVLPSVAGLDGIIFAGSTSGGRSDITETYDGTTFTGVASVTVASSSMAGGGSGADAMLVGGSTYSNNTCGSGSGYGYNSQCYTYQPDSWTTESNINQCVRGNSGGGTSASGMVFGGEY